MSFLNSSKQLKQTKPKKKTKKKKHKKKKHHFVNADVTDMPPFCNLYMYQLKTSLIAEPLVRIAYNFGCTLQKNPLLIYFAHFVLP